MANREYQLVITILLILSSTIAPCIGSSFVNNPKNESFSQMDSNLYSKNLFSPHELFKIPPVVHSTEKINDVIVSDTFGYSVHNTTDGGYIIGGMTTAYNLEPYELYYEYGLLIKFTASGQEEWNCTLKSGLMNIYSCDQTKENGYIATGGIQQTCEENSYTFLTKISEQGTVLWEKYYHIQDFSMGQSVQQTSDGGYIISGFTYAPSNGYSFYLLKTNQEGNQQWLYISTISPSIQLSAQQTNDGGYVVGGTTGSSTMRAFIIKFNSTGGEEWNNTYNILNDTLSVSVQQTTDSGFIITGETFNNITENGVMFILKTDSYGQEEWNQTYISSIYPLLMGYCVHQTLDLGYIILEWAGTGGDYFTKGVLLKTDENGIEQWNTTLDYGLPFSLDVANDHGYIITSYFGVGNLIKVQENGTIEWIQPYSWKDFIPPTLSIISPTNGLYLRDRQFLSRLQKTIIVGDITVKVDAFDTDTEVTQVDYYIDDNLMGTDVVHPFEWIWDERSFSHHIIKIVVEDVFGNQACQIQHVFKIF